MPWALPLGKRAMGKGPYLLLWASGEGDAFCRASGRQGDGGEELDYSLGSLLGPLPEIHVACALYNV